MLRAFFSRVVALLVLCVWVLGCSGPDHSGNSAETLVTTRTQGLDAGADGGVCVSDGDCGTGCGICQEGTCVVAGTSVVCRAAVGLCDESETCDGIATSCPADAKKPNSVQCRAPAGLCDEADFCAGGDDCPDVKKPNTEECRPAAGACDAAETCDGSTNNCPLDLKQPSTVECRAAAGACDAAEHCGGGDECPPDVKQPNTVQCRGAAGVCDAAENCNGGDDCPADVKQPNTVQCRGAVGVCDAVENCNGSDNCPADVKQPNSVQCRGAVGVCDAAENCSGGDDCPPDLKQPNTVICRSSQGDCDPSESCNGGDACPADLKQPSTVVCRPSQGDCDPAENCNGGNTCPVDAKQPNTFVCRASLGDCDPAETCNGGNICPIDVKQPNTHVCRALAGPCDVAENCGGGNTCPTDVFKDSSVGCRAAAGTCDLAESCTGSDAQCPADKFRDSNAECRPSAGVCDLAEQCTGASALCPADVFAPVTVQCRDVLNGNVQCDQPEFCNGSGAQCPPNAYKPKGTPCDDQFDCTVSDVCDGATGACAGTPDNARCEPDKHTCGFVFCAVNKGCDFTPNPKTKVCRAAVGTCDVAENCDGVNQDCPADVIKTNTDVCQALSCMNATLKPEISCTGLSGVCPTVPDVSCGNYACGSAMACRTTCVTSSDCGSAFYCDSNACVPRIGAGQPCQSDSECPISNNHCVDGVCCDTTCTGQCEACNLPSSPGTCVGVTGTPVAPRKPCAADGTKCDGFCDPTNHTECQFPAKGTPCKDASCDSVKNQAFAESFCTGKGACAVTDAVSCAPYACVGAACAGDCMADAQCAKNAYCQAGKCTPKAKLADKCTSDKQCGSGHCVDGVCCDTACTGQCEACAGISGAKAGTCSAVTGDPLGKRGACAATDAACAGTCDGSDRTSCRYPGQGKTCRDGACSAGQATVKAYCDGHGACPAALTISCEQGCEGAVCAGDQCVLDADCKDAGKYCAAGVCTPKGGAGSACPTATACASGFCTDGVCCDSACLGQCEACDNSGSMGTCSAVTKGDSPHGGRTSCATDGSVCGGTCDGATRDVCKYPFDVVCRAASCMAGATPDDPASAIVEVSCVGNGSCPTEQQQLCRSDGCDDQNLLCNGACAVDKNACKKDEYCAAGECVPKLEIADHCANDAQCESHFCVDGVCCDARCGDQCAACDVPGSLGTCSAVTGDVHGGRAACGGIGTCGATCDGIVVASCSFPDEQVSCGEAFCSEGVMGKAPVCDGQGLCAPAESTACKSFRCEGTQCSTACTSSEECVKELECRDGQCVPPLKIAAVDEGSCGCSVPGSRLRGPAGALGLLAWCALSVLRRRRRRAFPPSERRAA